MHFCFAQNTILSRVEEHVHFRVECCNFQVCFFSFSFKVYKATGEEFLKIAGGK